MKTAHIVALWGVALLAAGCFASDERRHTGELKSMRTATHKLVIETR